MTYPELIECLKILDKTTAASRPTVAAAEHDVIWFEGPNPTTLNEHDLAWLDDHRVRYDEDVRNWRLEV